MHATIYGRGQMVIPARARNEAGITAGDVVSVQPEGNGRLVLVRLEKPLAMAPVKARVIHRKGRHPVGDTGRPITSAQVRELLKGWLY